MGRQQALQKLLFVSGFLIVLLIGLGAQAKNRSEVFHHEIQVELVPSLKMLKATDKITFPSSSPRKTTIALNKNLTITSVSPGDKLIALPGRSPITPQQNTHLYQEWGLELGSNDNTVTIEYHGMIDDSPADGNSEGFISSEGAVLLGSTYWHPDVLGSVKSFRLSVSHPHDWKMASQGQLISQETFAIQKTTTHTENSQQQDIYLIVGPFFEYTREWSQGKKIRVLLRKDEKDLAQNYLALLPDYLEHYSKVIAPYPYTHFTVIENFWETGFGMPGFTLLGPSVVRLPFILYSSLPHEVLHNWWGNSVYVDYFNGNWCEGLTNHMADHWQQQTKNAGAEYRLGQLMAYADYVKTEDEISLADFRGRHNEASQAIGYSKGMMFFHMLEKKVGSQKFKEALQDFYFKNVYTQANYDDIQSSFEGITGQDLSIFFNQWVQKPGAPELRLGQVSPVLWADGTWATTWDLQQDVKNVYDLDVPVRWTLENGRIVNQVVRFKDAHQNFIFLSDSRPVKIEVDPEFDLFRRLSPEERPATFSSIFGANKTTVFYTPESAHLLEMAKTWELVFKSRFDYLEVDESFSLPAAGAVILLGNHRTMRELVRQQAGDKDLKIFETHLEIDGSLYPYDDHSSALVFRNRANPHQYISWVPSALPPVEELARRMTHYGKYSVLAFKGRPNVLKKTLPPANSPLKKRL